MTIFKAALVALAIFAFFRVTTRVLKNINRRQLFWRRLSFWLSGTEIIVWFLWLFWVMYYFIRDQVVYSYLTVIIILLALGMVTWFVLRDIVAGIVFKLKHNIRVNQSIRVGELMGKVVHVGNTSLVLESAGEQLKVPYSQLVNETVGQFHASEAIHPYNFNLQVAPHNSKDAWLNILQKQILLLPWANFKKPPVIHFKSEASGNFVFDIRVYTLNEIHAGLIEKQLQQQYQSLTEK